MTKRSRIFIALAGLLVLVAAWSLWPDGTITVNFKDAPLPKVLAAIERQGRVKIETNLPPETLVTLQVRRAPLMLALETLAARVDAEIRPAVLAAPDKASVQDILADVGAGKRSEKWVVASSPNMGLPVSAIFIDARALPVTLESSDDNSLQNLLRQLSAKSGLTTAVPKEWNPSLSKLPPAGPAENVAETLISSQKGHLLATFLLIGRPPEGERAGQPADRQAGMDGGPRRWQVNPEWVAARTQAVIAQLPPEERAPAQAEFDQMRALWKEVASLPEDQRREKMAEVFNRPEVQERMMERQEARDALRTPEQREKRMKSYIERKKAMKETAKPS